MQNSKIVVKFGGSNLKTIPDINKIVRVVQSYNQPIVIVVSAFYGITNKLLGLINNITAHDINSFLEWLINKKVNIIKSIINDKTLKIQTIKELNNRIGNLKSLLFELKSNVENKSVLDAILSQGEILSSLIITAVLKENNINASEVFPEHIGLITDGKHKNASVKLSVSEKQVKQTLSANKTFVIPGFYGISPEGKITLLGRGGTDYSAASVANCINAKSLDVWKDVDGFMSANPKFVNNAQKIKSLTYDEAAELAYFGAQILHPGTLEPLQLKNIPLQIFNIKKQLYDSNPKSIINGKSRIINNRIKSVTYSENFSFLKLKGASVGIKPGILAKITTILEQNDINIKSVITSQIAINLLLSRSDINKAAKLIQTLNNQDIQEIELHKNIALIATVGEGITEKYGIAAKVFTTVANNAINVQMIAFGASRVSSYFIVDLIDKEKTIKAIHKAFFGEKKVKLNKAI
ncbi:MAG: aspartate kinase [Chlorobi bacterium]|nr:aspartate kinase [Chlorobiota bacterium]